MAASRRPADAAHEAMRGSRAVRPQRRRRWRRGVVATGQGLPDKWRLAALLLVTRVWLGLEQGLSQAHCCLLCVASVEAAVPLFAGRALASAAGGGIGAAFVSICADATQSLFVKRICWRCNSGSRQLNVLCLQSLPPPSGLLGHCTQHHASRAGRAADA